MIPACRCPRVRLDDFGRLRQRDVSIMIFSTPCIGPSSVVEHSAQFRHLEQPAYRVSSHPALSRNPNNTGVPKWILN